MEMMYVFYKFKYFYKLYYQIFIFLIFCVVNYYFKFLSML